MIPFKIDWTIEDNFWKVITIKQQYKVDTRNSEKKWRKELLPMTLLKIIFRNLNLKINLNINYYNTYSKYNY